KSMTIKQVPEPGLLLLVLTGLVGVIAARRMRVQI
ncbi:MAG TPA: PEP-CTERM sorting domain-containing protein, partial [Gammaproteobacteria bacterium]|nr:PEP-CTERM sorting domain-containing protein [Gammaproteobacteria bacterium]